MSCKQGCVGISDVIVVARGKGGKTLVGRSSECNGESWIGLVGGWGQAKLLIELSTLGDLWMFEDCSCY